jgi:hypothetical protein
LKDGKSLTHTETRRLPRARPRTRLEGRNNDELLAEGEDEIGGDAAWAQAAALAAVSEEDQAAAAAGLPAALRLLDALAE